MSFKYEYFDFYKNIIRKLESMNNPTKRHIIMCVKLKYVLKYANFNRK